jgi:cell division transport system permease protein
MKINPAYFTREALSSLRHNLVQSIAAITTVALCLVVVGLIMLILLVGGDLIKDIKDKVEIEIFLGGPAITAVQSNSSRLELEQELQETLQSWDEVKEVEYISKEKALNDFKKTFKEPGVIDQLTVNPLPASYRVSLHDPEDVDKVAKRVKALPSIDSLVENPENDIKYAKETVEKLFAVTGWVSVIAGAFASLLIFVSLVLITNTIRMAIFARRKEIGIMKLVGASSWFIRWPFVLEGMLEGLVGAVIAIIALTAIWRTVVTKSGQVFTFMKFSFDQTAFVQLLIVLAVSGAVIGAMGSMIALRRFLKV